MNQTLNRRGFLARSAAVPLLASSIGPGIAAAQAPIRRAGGPHLKTSLNAYSFSKMLNDHLAGRGGGISLMELLDYCAGLDFDGIDPTGYFFPGYPAVPSDRYIAEFKRRAFHLGLGISGTGVRNNFASPDGAKRSADVRHAREWVEVAARLGAPVLRVFAGPEPAGVARDEAEKWVVDALREVAEHGAKHGVVIGLQNHGDLLKTSDHVLGVLKAVGSEWCGAIVDTGYFPAADPYPHITAVAPFAVNWQVKEFSDGMKFTARTDLGRVVGIARQAGYRGYLPIETLSRTGEVYDPRVRVARLLGELKRAIA